MSQEHSSRPQGKQPSQKSSLKLEEKITTSIEDSLNFGIQEWRVSKPIFKFFIYFCVASSLAALVTICWNACKSIIVGTQRMHSTPTPEPDTPEGIRPKLLPYSIEKSGFLERGYRLRKIGVRVGSSKEKRALTGSHAMKD